MQSRYSGFIVGAWVVLAGMVSAFPASTVQFGQGSYRVDESAGEVVLLVTREGDPGTLVTVEYLTVDSTALAGEDYRAASGTLTFAAGQTNLTLRIEILNDARRESAETFAVTLVNPSSNALLGTRLRANVPIQDNDTGIRLEFPRYWANEGSGSVLIGVVRAPDENWAATVNYATVAQNALPGTDYADTRGTLNFAPGDRLQWITIPILNDGDRESDERFEIRLSSDAGNVLGVRTNAVITITDNDPGLGFLSSTVCVQENEGAVVLTCHRGSDGRLGAFTVDYETIGGTAAGGNDYVETRGTLSFAEGEMTRSIVVPIIPDAVAERDEQFKLVLSHPSGGMVLAPSAVSTATVTVCDITEMRPHRLECVRQPADGTVVLKLTGGFASGLGLSNRFRPYFDVFPIETSSNLVDWSPWRSVVRTNASGAETVVKDAEVPNFGQRYYRTPSNNFVSPLRAPTGPYRVGYTDRVLQDDTRRNRYRISTNGSFPITIWYPAKAVAGQWPVASYEPEVLARDTRAGAWEDFVDRAPYWIRNAVLNAPFAEGLASRPIVLWSPGYLWARYSGHEWAEHLASHGYVVVGIDHADSSVVVFPDGRYLYTLSTDTLGREIGPSLVQDRVRDCTLILDMMTRWNLDDPLFASRLDPRNAAAMGWSLGAETAAELARIDPRVRAAVVLEGALQNNPVLLEDGLPKPVLSMYREDRSDLAFFDKLRRDAVYFQVRYTEHDSFNTYYWQAALTNPESLARSREAARTITDYSLWFLNRHLLGLADSMPEPARYPQVFNFRQK